MPRTPLERVLLLAAVLLPAVLIANTVVSFVDVQNLVRYEAEVTHTYRVLTVISDYVAALADAETGNRGYIITGEQSYLAPYWVAPEELRRATNRLDSLFAGNPAQLARLDELHAHGLRRYDFLSQTMRLRAEGGLEAAQQSIMTGDGTRAMEAVRYTADAMRRAEIDLLNARIEASSRAAQRTFLTQGIATAAALALLVALYLLSRRLLRIRAELTVTLRNRRDELETLVQQRTLALSATNERLQDEVAERRRIEQELRAFTLELERSNRELEDFAFIASHDLQEPLRKIQVFSDRLGRRQAGALTEAAREDVERISRSAARMRALVNDLLAYARVGRRASEPQPVPLDDVLADVLDTLETRIEEAGARIEAGALPVVPGDRAQLGQLLLNLLSNALKFRHQDVEPYIKVVATTEEGYLRLSVSDNGIGFDSHHAERIFSPFERLHGTEHFPGTGIGLAVCRRIVEQHRGTITAQSESGAGATFLVTLPLSAHAIHASPVYDDPHGG